MPRKTTELFALWISSGYHLRVMSLNRSVSARDQCKFLPNDLSPALGLSFYVSGEIPVERSLEV